MEQQKEKNSFWELLQFAIIALVIVIPIRLFVAQPFVVSGTSMIPTFENGDYLIVDEISYRFKDPQRGDVIVSRYPNDVKKFFIKRVIGLPGESVVIKEGKVQIVQTDGSIIDLKEDYITEISRETKEIKVPDNSYIVLGDNRKASSDSRTWGPLDENLVVGKAFVRILPIAHAGFLPGHVDDDFIISNE